MIPYKISWSLVAVILLIKTVHSQNNSATLTPGSADNSTVTIADIVTSKQPNNVTQNGKTPTPSSTVTTKQSSTTMIDNNCHLVANDSDVISNIKTLLSGGAKIMKYNVHVENEEAVLSKLSEGLLYKPLFWVRTTGRQGRNILLLRPEYDVLSLSTLSFDIYTINVTLVEEPRNCLSELGPVQIEALIRELVMNDFQNTSTDHAVEIGPTDNVCNMHIINETGVAQFKYYCCNRTSKMDIQCRYLETEVWLDVLFGVVTLIKIIVILFSPNWIPETIYRLKQNIMPFTYITQQEEPVKLRTVLTNRPENYPNAKTVCKISKFLHMTKFKETMQRMIPDVKYDFQFQNVQLMLKQKRLLASGSAPVGFFESLYDTLVRCKIREKKSLQTCCDANICPRACCKDECSWYRLLKEVMSMLMLVLIALPWILRVKIYYNHEHDELEMRRIAANEKGLRFYFPGNMTLYLTPLHALFIMMYVILTMESFVFGVFRKRTKEKLKFVLRKCFNDMKEINKQQVTGWVVQMLLLPCVCCGLFGIIIAPISWLITLPIALLVLSFYMLPTVNLTGRLLAHFVVYALPREAYTRCKFSARTSSFIESIEKTLEAKVDMKEMAINESLEMNETALRTKRGRFQQLIIILFCLISLYSCIFLLTEFVSFFVEVIVYTLIGVILNASLTLTYISLGLYVVFYANDVVGSVAKTFYSYSSDLNAYILGLGKEQAEPVFFKNFENQLNRAFRVKTGRPCLPKRPVVLIKNDENEPRWKFTKLVLFVTKTDQPQIPKKFFFEACNMPYSMVPGQLFSSYVSAFKELGFIFVFLIFVLIVVLAFGETYELSATNRLLATIVSGFLPLILRRVLFKSHSVPSINTGSDINFQVCIYDLLNGYEQTFPIYDIDVTEGSPTLTIDNVFISSEGLEDKTPHEINDENPINSENSDKENGSGEGLAEKANHTDNVDATYTEDDDDAMDLVISIHEMDTEDFPDMAVKLSPEGRDIGSTSFLDDDGEKVALSSVKVK